MEKKQRSYEFDKKGILFPNGNKAQLVAPPSGTSAGDILKELSIEQPKALLIIIGGAAGLDEALKPRLTQLFSRGIFRAAVETEALIIDGGTQAGVMAMMGQVVADREKKPSLIGVAPAGKVTYPGGPEEGSIEDGAALDSNHSHFVLVESNEWGGEIDTMFELAGELAKGIPVVTVLINGGLIAKDEVLQSVRKGWPVIVLKGSKRLADEISKFWEKKPDFIEDSITAEIIADGDIHLFPVDGSIEGFKELVIKHLKIDPTLRLAWERFAAYDENAGRQQDIFNKFQRWILTLGVLVTLLALTQTHWIGKGILDPDSWQKKTFQYVIVAIPVIVSILVAIANRFKAGNKWILQRASAEAIKREIYSYRARANNYSGLQINQISRDAKLADELKSISSQLMQTEVNLSALRPYDGPIPPKMFGAAKADDGFSFLSPKRYISVRLDDQLNYYRLKTTKLEKQLKRLHWLIYIFGGVGTLLAAVGLEIWVALTAALVGAFSTLLEYQQVENSLIKYNQAATDLANIKAWWTALSYKEKTDPNNTDMLVGNAEKILQSELSGWAQRMEDALAELRAQQIREYSKKEMNKA